MFEPIREGNYGYVFDNTNGVQVSIYLFEGENILKTVDLYHGGGLGDFSFCLTDFAYENNSIKQSFVINQPNLLYDSFSNLLGSEERLIIDDDDTCSKDVKYLQLEKIDHDLILTFTNNKECNISYEKYAVFVKNTLYDLRSKIDQQGLNTKSKLWDFFSEAFSVLTTYHLDNTKSKCKTKN